MTDDTPRTVTLWRFRFDNTVKFKATEPSANYAWLSHRWHAGTLEKQTVTYSAWVESDPPPNTEGT